MRPRVRLRRSNPPSETKQYQAPPNKTKQNCLDLLGFIRPNRDFSMGYDEFQIRIFLLCLLAAGRSAKPGLDPASHSE